MTSATLTRAGAALAAACFVAVGCGGEPTPARPAASHPGSAFETRAHALFCERNHRIASIALGHVFSGDDGATTDVDAAREVLSALHGAYDRLAALPVTPPDRGRVAPVLRAMRVALEEADADPARLGGADDPFARVDDEQAAQGFDACD